MRIDLPQPAPRVRTLDEAQALIDQLWPLLRALAARNEEQAQLFQRQGAIIEAQAKRIEALEEQLRTNSRNSSRPPSADQNRPARTKKPPGGGKPGGQLGHPGKARVLLAAEHIAQVHDCRPVARHQVIDLPPLQPVVTEYRRYAGVCRRCEAALPPGVTGWVTGSCLQALIGALTGGYRLNKRQTQGLLADLFGIELSAGAISQGEAELSAALEPIAQRTGGARRFGDRLCRHPGVGPLRGLCQGRCAAPATVLGVSGARLHEDGRAQRYVRPHRRRIARTPKRMFGFWYRVRDGTLSRAMFATHMQFLRAQIEAAWRRGADCRHAQTARTCRHILRLQPALWTFADMPGVEPANNLAERALRSYVIWRKVGFGAQSARGSRYLERIMTVVGSCKLQERNLLGSLMQAVQAHWGSGSLPSLGRLDAVAG